MPRTRLFSSIALILLFALVTPAADSFSLEQVLNSPFAAELTGSPRGDVIAWVSNDEGKRNIWIAKAPAFRPAQVTRFYGDDGQEISELVFSPDSNWLAFVRGGPSSANEEAPNPAGIAAGVQRQIWLTNLRTGRSEAIAAGSDHFFSPDGRRLFYIAESSPGRLSTIGIGVSIVRFPPPSAQSLSFRGGFGFPDWSPDGSRLVFATLRGDHNFISLFEEKSGRVRYLDPSADRDVEPVWSPDGKQIAFIRLFNVVDTYGPDKERLQPWSIRVVNADTGKGKEIWRSGESETDSYSMPGKLAWLSPDRLVFGSEADGWAHLYSVSATGGTATQLTRGKFEVSQFVLSPDRSYAILATNQNDMDRSHLWRLEIASGTLKPLTTGKGIEFFPIVTDGGRQVAFLRSTGIEPLLPHVIAANGSALKPLAKVDAGFPAASLVEPEQVVIKAPDGTDVHCQLFKAKGSSGRQPAVVHLHGGPARQMLLGWHWHYYYHYAYGLNQYLASRGYAVLSVNFRAGVGYGRAFREAKRRGGRGASEYQDVLAAGRYLAGRDDVDPKRIGIWGGSYGGFLTALALARNSDVFAAGVDTHGVHDWSARVPRGITGPALQELNKLARESSPLSAVDTWKSPVLFIHGDDDRTVAFSQTVELIRKLREKRLPFEQLILPDEAHDFLRHETWLRAYRATSEFFDEHLRQGAGARR